MTTSNAMGPPLSPREPRRSGRRSLPATAGSSNTSKSSKSSSPGPENGIVVSSAPVVTPTTPVKAVRNGKRVKEEAEEGAVVVQPKKGGKRKSKKEEKIVEVLVEDLVRDLPVEDGEDPDEGVTRCVCGMGGTQNEEEEENSFSFWIQCETCKVWQHGQCVGYEKEEDAPEHYHCEMCRPDLHEELLNKRQPSRHRKTASISIPTRSSRSHSPSHSLALATPIDKVAKRRNTMNSRETAYHDQMMKQVVEGSLQLEPSADGLSVIASTIHPDDEVDGEPNSKRRRKRSEASPLPDLLHTKTTRSESSTSDRPIAATIMEQHIITKEIVQEPEEGLTAVATPAPPTRTASRSKKKKDVGDPDRKRHPNQYTYRRNNANRAGANGVTALQAQSQAQATHEHRTRGNPQPPRAHVPAPQPLLTTWGLPDYLNHLQDLLPSDIPAPLDVPGFGEERGVKVKWPGKRMSLSDMGKRVRSLMEWVSREQGSYSERARRKEAIERAIEADSIRAAFVNVASGSGSVNPVRSGEASAGNGNDDMEVDNAAGEGASTAHEPLKAEAVIPDDGMAEDGAELGAPQPEPKRAASDLPDAPPATETEAAVPISHDSPGNAASKSSSFEKATTQLMEELMQDLIGFQEKFGSQTKVKELLSF